MKYLKAIEQAGGIPVVIPPMAPEAFGPLLSRVGGVCLSGGPDLDPVAYGDGRHDRLGPTWSELDVFELALARAADARRLPVLAICRGLQVLNVARGGSLHQHLPDVAGEALNHRQERPGREPTHAVSIVAGTQLARVLGAERAEVNSFHHQGVDRLGNGLLVSARADDGIVEGIEAADREFLLGVQWHAECLVERPEHAALFAAFVEAARDAGEAGARFARVA
jgi:putative glutamine amidotransferase